MENDINQYFPPNSIFKFDVNDDDYLEADKNTDSDTASNLEENDVYIPRGGLSPERFNEKKSINKYFSQNSIFISDDDDDTEQVKIRSKPRSPRQNISVDELEKLVLPTFDGENDIPAKAPKIKIEDTDNGDEDYMIYDTPPPPLPKPSRKTFNFLEEEKLDGCIDTSSTRLENKRGSCPGSIGTWERYSLMNQRYDNLLAAEGLEFSAEYECVSFSSSSESHKPSSGKKSFKDMMLSVFPNRIFLSVSDTEIDKPQTLKMNQSKSKPQNRKCPQAIRGMKEIMSSKYKEIRSAVISTVKRNSEGPLTLNSFFCVPAGCANVSSIAKYDNGHCWVAADRSECILLYDRDGNLLDFVNVGCPVDSLTTDKYGNVFMSCPDLKQVRVFDRNRHVKTFLDMTQYPRGIAYMELSESILVCRNNNRVANDLTVKACNPLKKYRIRGPKPQTEDVLDSMFGYPLRVCVNVNHDYVVSDFANRSITVIDSSGRTRFSFKSSKDFPIRNRHSVCCDTKGNIYIFSKGKPNVCILEPNGNVKDMFSCSDLYNETVFAAVFDTDGYLWLACLDGFIRIFELT